MSLPNQEEARIDFKFFVKKRTGSLVLGIVVNGRVVDLITRFDPFSPNAEQKLENRLLALADRLNIDVNSALDLFRLRRSQLVMGEIAPEYLEDFLMRLRSPQQTETTETEITEDPQRLLEKRLRKFESLPEEIKKILLSEDILDFFVEEFKKKIAGNNDDVIALVFLSFISAKTNKAFCVMLQGESSIGKTHIVKTIMEAFKMEEDFIDASYLSPSAMRYLNETLGRGVKTLVIFELEKMSSPMSLQIKAVGDRLQIISWVTERGEEGKGFHVKRYVAEVKNIITTTTQIALPQDVENRFLKLYPDPSVEASIAAWKVPCIPWAPEPQYDLLKQVLECIEDCEVLYFGFEWDWDENDLERIRKMPEEAHKRARRDVHLILAVASALACLRQWKRFWFYGHDGKLYVVMHPKDLEDAIKLCRKWLAFVYFRLEPRFKKVFDALVRFYQQNNRWAHVDEIAQMVKEEKIMEENSLLYDDLVALDGIGEKTANYLVELCQNDKDWVDCHPALSLALPDIRFAISKVLLDFMRRSLAIKVSYLESDRQEQIQQQSFQRLIDPWAIDEDEHMEHSSILFPRSKRKKGDFGGNVFFL